MGLCIVWKLNIVWCFLFEHPRIGERKRSVSRKLPNKLWG